MSDRYISVAEVATRWGVSERTIRRLLAGGQLPAMKIGSAVRVSISDLVAYEAERRARGAIGTTTS